MKKQTVISAGMILHAINETIISTSARLIMALIIQSTRYETGIVGAALAANLSAMYSSMFAAKAAPTVNNNRSRRFFEPEVPS